jgi:hypothetical protein
LGQDAKLSGRITQAEKENSSDKHRKMKRCYQHHDQRHGPKRILHKRRVGLGLGRVKRGFDPLHHDVVLLVATLFSHSKQSVKNFLRTFENKSG